MVRPRVMSGWLRDLTPALRVQACVIQGAGDDIQGYGCKLRALRWRGAEITPLAGRNCADDEPNYNDQPDD